MKKEITDIEDIKAFVNEFYGKVKNDALIGPVFLEKITGDWQPHLNKCTRFGMQRYLAYLVSEVILSLNTRL